MMERERKGVKSRVRVCVCVCERERGRVRERERGIDEMIKRGGELCRDKKGQKGKIHSDIK